MGPDPGEGDCLDRGPHTFVVQGNVIGAGHDNPGGKSTGFR